MSKGTTNESPGELAHLLEYERSRVARLLELCEENGLVVPSSLLEPPPPYQEKEKLIVPEKEVVLKSKGSRKKGKGGKARDQHHDPEAIRMIESILQETINRATHNPIATAITKNDHKSLQELLSHSSREINSDITKPTLLSSFQQQPLLLSLEGGEGGEKGSSTKGLKRAVGSVSLRGALQVNSMGGEEDGEEGGEGRGGGGGGQREEGQKVTALHLACYQPNSIKLVGVLLSFGASIYTSEAPFSPLHVAALFARVEIVQVFFLKIYIFFLFFLFQQEIKRFLSLFSFPSSSSHFDPKNKTQKINPQNKSSNQKTKTKNTPYPSSSSLTLAQTLSNPLAFPSFSLPPPPLSASPNIAPPKPWKEKK